MPQFWQIATVADKPHLTPLAPTSQPANPSSWTGDGNSPPIPGGHTPLHSHKAPRCNWEPRNRRRCGCFQEVGWFACRLPACPCLFALTKRKECFPPQHGYAGIKTHSEWPWVVQQMLARIVLVAVSTVSWWDRPAQATLSPYMYVREGGCLWWVIKNDGGPFVRGHTLIHLHCLWSSPSSPHTCTELSSLIWLVVSDCCCIFACIWNVDGRCY